MATRPAAVTLPAANVTSTLPKAPPPSVAQPPPKARIVTVAPASPSPSVAQPLPKAPPPSVAQPPPKAPPPSVAPKAFSPAPVMVGSKAAPVEASAKLDSSVAEKAIKSGATKECFQTGATYSEKMDACLSCPDGYEILDPADTKCTEICSRKSGRWKDSGDSCLDLNSTGSKKETKRTMNPIKNKPVLHWYEAPCSTTDGVLDQKKDQMAAMKTCAANELCKGFSWDGAKWSLLKNVTPVKATNDYSECYLVKY